MPRPENRLDTRIAIVGAGPAGLSTAHYLKKQGYRHVKVFEKLGGNYITPAFRERKHDNSFKDYRTGYLALNLCGVRASTASSLSVEKNRADAAEGERPSSRSTPTPR